MPIKLEITGLSADEALGELLTFARPIAQGVNLMSMAASVKAEREMGVTVASPEPAAEAPAADTPVEPQPARRGRKPKAEQPAEPAAEAPAAPEPPAPAAPEPPTPAAPEPAAENPQDIFDEQPAPAAPKTRDDVKMAMTQYVTAFGMAAAQSDLPTVMGYKKLSDVPDDAAAFAAVISKIEAAVRDNPHGRAKVG